MTTLRPWILLICLLLASRAQGTSSVLRDIQRSVSKDHTRLSLVVSGSITYTAREEGRRLMLQFAGMHLATNLTSGRVYGDGLIEWIEFPRVEDDSLALVLCLRPGAAYRILRPSGGGVLEILAEGPPYVPPPPVKSAPRPDQAPSKPRNSTTSQTGRLIDIAALAMEQTGSAQEPAPAQSPREVKHPASHALPTMEAGASALGWVLAFLVSASTTTVTLLFLARRRRGREPLPEREADPDASGQEGVFSHELLRALHTPEQMPDEEEEQILEDEEPGSSWFAERFARGAEEVDLAFRLRGAGAAESKARIARELGSKTIPASRMAQSARRSGVGIGEMELARNLHSLALAQQGKEQMP